MPPFAVNPHRFDPYKHLRFQVVWDGSVVADVSRVGGLRRRTEVVVHRDGNEPSVQRRSPGKTVFEPIVLERGRTHDAAFEDWAALVFALGGEMSLRNFRKDVVIRLLNEAGTVTMAFNVYRCWPSEYVALAEMDANGHGVAFESLILEHEGWERDRSVTEPAET
ncbi:MAG TPA: phage tail protein [Gaiellaceae bacterium]|jgi:phage tail-like protein|nr:phage tail protein [Gaiellaceae bacterium]